jgi:hypothetical protein
MAARRKDPRLKIVVQANLYMPLLRARAGYLTEVAVRYPVVGISVAGDVEEVKEIGTEAKYIFAPYVEVLEQGNIDLAVARGALGVDARSSEGR